MNRRLSLEEARQFGSQEGNCTRLGAAHQGERWYCTHCRQEINGAAVVLDLDADAYACPVCRYWDTLVPPELGGGTASSLAYITKAILAFRTAKKVSNRS